MNRRIFWLGVILALLFSLTACTTILDGEKITVVPHPELGPGTAPSPASQITGYDELKAALLGLIEKHNDLHTFVVSDYDGDVWLDVEKVCGEVMETDVLAAYAVSAISYQIHQIFANFEVEFMIDYQKTAKQVSGVINAATLRYLRTELLTALSEYRGSVAFRTTSAQLTPELAVRYVSELYYENPVAIVMMPVTTVEFFPETGSERIVEYTFSYRYEKPETYRAKLASRVRAIAESTTGESDGVILLALCRRVMTIAEYDVGYNESTAALGEYSMQNQAATAYGALENGSAIGEGFAMAYKALCDELGIECYVVVGALDGIPHAWNIVFLEGEYYHLDVAMCDVNGIETAFLKNDETMGPAYEWDRGATRACLGTLTYADFAEE